MNTRKVAQEYRMNQWINIIREHRESGQTVTSWCREHDINPKRYELPPMKRFLLLIRK